MPTLANFAVAARGEWPLVEASLLPVLCLLLGVVGIVKTDTAVDIAIGAAWSSCSATASPPAEAAALDAARRSRSAWSTAPSACWSCS